MPGQITTADNGQRRSNAYASGSINGMKSNGYSKSKYYQSSRNEKYNHYNKSSININDPNDWPSLGEADTTTTATNSTTNTKVRTSNGPTSPSDTNGTVFKKKIVQTKNTSTPNGEMVETTVIEETDTFSKIVISKEPSNKDNNNNKLNGNGLINDNESTTETSSSGGNLDDSMDNSDEKENSKCDSSTSGSTGKNADQSTDAEQIDKQSNTSKSKKKSSKSKWKVLNIEQPSRMMDKRRFERTSHRDHYRDHRERDIRVSNGGARRRDFNNSNGKYGESNGGYYSGSKYSNYNGNYHNNHHSSSSNHLKDSQTTNRNGNSANEPINDKSNNDKVTDKTNATSTTNSTQTTTTSNQQQQQPNKSSSSNSYSGHYSNGGVSHSYHHHRQKRPSGRGMYRSNRSMSGYRRGGRSMYESGNVTPLSDYDSNGGGYYYDDVQSHTQLPTHNHQQQINGSNNSLSHQNSYVQPAYYIPYNATPIPRSVSKWPSLDELIRNQIEYYFSEANLQRDFFLRRKMDKEGYLPISLIASFHRVQALTLDVKDIIDSLRKSENIELSEDNKKLRVKNEPTKWPIMDQLFNYNATMFELSKGSMTSSCNNSKDASSTDSANDSRASGVSLSSTDLHPNVPDFIPGQPYGYLYDGANTTTCVYYPPTSFHPHKSPIETSYTSLNYQIPYANTNVYPLNSPSLTDNCLNDNSKTMNCLDDNEIINGVIQDDELPNQTNQTTTDMNVKKNESDNNNQINETNQNEASTDNQIDSELSCVSNDKNQQVIKTEKKKLDEKQNQQQTTKENNVKETNSKSNNNKSTSSKTTEKSTEKSTNEKSLSKDKVSKDVSMANKENVPKETTTQQKVPKDNSNLTSSKEVTNSNESTTNQQVKPQPVLPVKVLSYSDAIKSKDKPANKQQVKDEVDQIKKENETPNKQLTQENQKENRKDNKKSNEHHNKNKSSITKELSTNESSSKELDSSKEFHCFKSSKSNRNRTDKK